MAGQTKYRFQYKCSSRWGGDFAVYGGQYRDEQIRIAAADDEAPTGYMRWVHFADQAVPVDVFDAFMEHTAQEHQRWYENAMKNARDDIDHRIINEVHEQALAERPRGISRWVSGREWEIVYQVEPTTT